MVIQTEYLIDGKGQKKSVVLSIRDYLRLVEHMEDLEDAVDLKKARESAKGFVELRRFLLKLKKQKRIH